MSLRRPNLALKSDERDKKISEQNRYNGGDAATANTCALNVSNRQSRFPFYILLTFKKEFKKFL